jgi:hypothetical protein
MMTLQSMVQKQKDGEQLMTFPLGNCLQERMCLSAIKIMSKRGGARKGAGRKPGSFRGKKAVIKTITMRQDQWDKIDAARGTIPRSRFIARNMAGE